MMITNVTVDQEVRSENGTCDKVISDSEHR